jgi:hypothetical protein
MSAPARTRGARSRKRTPARPTAHVGYQPAGLDRWGHRVKATYHAIADQAVKVGFVTRQPGTAVCGSAGPWAPVPDGLFPPTVSCRACQHITANQHITIAGGTS